MSTYPRRRRVLLPLVLVGAGLLVAACGTTSPGAVANAGTSGSGSSALLSTRSTALGTIVVNGAGRTVYLFAADTPGHSACTGSCLQYWPPVPAPSTVPTSPPGITGTLGVLDRPDGSKQLTLGGWPLYTYAGDSGPGSTSGEGLNLSGGLWWAVSPSGTAVKPGSAPSPSPSPSSGSGGYARGY